MKHFFASLLLFSFLSISHAAIVDTANNSFIDDATGLEWADFGGITDGVSFDYVNANLGGIYSDWRLPTQFEVEALWDSMFAEFITGSIIRRPQPAGGYFISEGLMNGGTTAWMALFAITGSDIFKITENKDSNGNVVSVTRKDIVGSYFLTDDSTIGLFGYNGTRNCSIGCGQNAQIQLSSNNGTGLPFRSTMLVAKTNVAVPEVNSIYLLAIGLLGLLLVVRKNSLT